MQASKLSQRVCFRFTRTLNASGTPVREPASRPGEKTVQQRTVNQFHDFVRPNCLCPHCAQRAEQNLQRAQAAFADLQAEPLDAEDIMFELSAEDRARLLQRTREQEERDRLRSQREEMERLRQRERARALQEQEARQRREAELRQARLLEQQERAEAERREMERRLEEERLKAAETEAERLRVQAEREAREERERELQAARAAEQKRLAEAAEQRRLAEEAERKLREEREREEAAERQRKLALQRKKEAEERERELALRRQREAEEERRLKQERTAAEARQSVRGPGPVLATVVAESNKSGAGEGPEIVRRFANRRQPQENRVQAVDPEAPLGDEVRVLEPLSWGVMEYLQAFWRMLKDFLRRGTKLSENARELAADPNARSLVLPMGLSSSNLVRGTRLLEWHIRLGQSVHTNDVIATLQLPSGQRSALVYTGKDTLYLGLQAVEAGALLPSHQSHTVLAILVRRRLDAPVLHKVWEETKPELPRPQKEETETETQAKEAEEVKKKKEAEEMKKKKKKEEAEEMERKRSSVASESSKARAEEEKETSRQQQQEQQRQQREEREQRQTPPQSRPSPPRKEKQVEDRSYAHRITPAVGYHLNLHRLRSEEISGTGPKGMILKGDILKALESGAVRSQRQETTFPITVPYTPPPPQPQTSPAASVVSSGEFTWDSSAVLGGRSRWNVRRVRPHVAEGFYREMEGLGYVPPTVSAGAAQPGNQSLRRNRGVRGNPAAAAAAEVRGAAESIPHLYVKDEIAIGGLVEVQRQVNETLLKEGHPQRQLTLYDFMLRAAALALRDVPKVNSVWRADGRGAEPRQEVNLGIGVGTEGGGILTPVIQDADRLGLFELQDTANDLAERARTGQLLPEELENGTFTVSNLRNFGVESFGAVVNHPQTAILAVGQGYLAREDRSPLLLPEEMAVEDFLEGQVTQPSDILLPISVSADSRVLSQTEILAWIESVKQYMETPEGLLERDE